MSLFSSAFDYSEYITLLKEFRILYSIVSHKMPHSATWKICSHISHREQGAKPALHIFNDAQTEESHIFVPNVLSFQLTYNYATK